MAPYEQQYNLRKEKKKMDAQEAKRCSQVSEWLEMEKKGIAEAGEIQAEMENRLSSVLRPDQPLDESKKVEAVEEIVPLANEIRGIVWGLARISRSYKSMLSRLELP